MNWKKELEEEVQPKELVRFIQRISSRDLEPLQFEGLLKVFCVKGWVENQGEVTEGLAVGTEPATKTSMGEVEEVEKEAAEGEAGEEVEVELPGAKASKIGMRPRVQITDQAVGDAPTENLARHEGSDGCAPSNSASTSSSAPRLRPKPRPYEELLSELIDRYIELKKPQRIEIMQFLDELEKENKKGRKRLSHKKR